MLWTGQAHTLHLEHSTSQSGSPADKMRDRQWNVSGDRSRSITIGRTRNAPGSMSSYAIGYRYLHTIDRYYIADDPTNGLLTVQFLFFHSFPDKYTPPPPTWIKSWHWSADRTLYLVSLRTAASPLSCFSSGRPFNDIRFFTRFDTLHAWTRFAVEKKKSFFQLTRCFVKFIFRARWKSNYGNDNLILIRRQDEWIGVLRPPRDHGV